MVDIGLHFFHQFQSSRGYVPRVHDQDNSVGPCGGGGHRLVLQQDGDNITLRDRDLLR
jgi:hypothetical protein